MIPSDLSLLKQFRTSDGYMLSNRIWPVTQPLAYIVGLHGIISHGGWYLKCCSALARAGFEVHFLERRGSGLNAAERGDVNGYVMWLTDLESYLKQLPHGLSKLLLGISWGGKLATALVWYRRDLIQGLILVCPGLFAKQGANVWQKVALAVATRARWAQRRVNLPLHDPQLFTDALHWQQYIRTDPLVLRQVTIRFAWTDQQLSRYATRWNGTIDCPLLLMLTGNDRIIDNPRVSAFIYEKAPHVHLVEYSKAAHTFDFGPVAKTSHDDIVRWARYSIDVP